MSIVELIATILGFICTWFSIKQDNRTWPFGIVAVALYAVLFFHVKLYADMVLQFVYIILMVYGWYQWMYGGENKSELAISNITLQQLIILGLIAIVGTSCVTYGLKNFTDSQLYFWDALTTVLSLIAQWMLAKKILQTWILWFITDAIYVVLYIYKSLFLTSMLYATFTGLAVLGYIWWHRADAKLINISN